MIALSVLILAVVGTGALLMPATWRIAADLLLSMSRHAGAVALTLEAVPDTYRQAHGRAREMTGERA